MRIALIVYVKKYDDRAIVDLESTTNDASDLKTFVKGELPKELRFEVVLLDDPTARNLYDALQKAKGKLLEAEKKAKKEGRKERNLFLFFFAGHGFARDDGSQYLLCADAIDVNSSSALIGGIEPVVLQEFSKGLQNTDVVFWIDACRGQVLRHKGDEDYDLGKFRDVCGKALKDDTLKDGAARLTINMCDHGQRAADDGLTMSLALGVMRKSLDSGKGVLLDSTFAETLRKLLKEKGRRQTPVANGRPIWLAPGVESSEIEDETNVQKVQEHITQGLKFLGEKKYDAALSEANAALRLDPKNEGALALKRQAENPPKPARSDSKIFALAILLVLGALVWIFNGKRGTDFVIVDDPQPAAKDSSKRIESIVDEPERNLYDLSTEPTDAFADSAEKSDEKVASLPSGEENDKEPSKEPNDELSNLGAVAQNDPTPSEDKESQTSVGGEIMNSIADLAEESDEKVASLTSDEENAKEPPKESNDESSDLGAVAQNDPKSSEDKETQTSSVGEFTDAFADSAEESDEKVASLTSDEENAKEPPKESNDESSDLGAVAQNDPKPSEAKEPQTSVGGEITNAEPRAGERREVNINGVVYGFCWIPPGTFARSNNSVVRLTRGFWMLETPVTQGLWKSITGKNPSWFCSTGGGSERVAGMDTTNFPVEEVSWNDCQEFLKKLNELDAASGRKFRLPTEAEWEYACRAGTTTTYWWGDSLNGDKANCDGNYPCGTNQKGEYLIRTCAVKSYDPNPWGLYDVHGNVWEWCSDGYGKYPSGDAVDPTGAENASSRVMRGGCWYALASICRSANRNGSDPADRYPGIGFRLVLE